MSKVYCPHAIDACHSDLLHCNHIEKHTETEKCFNFCSEYDERIGQEGVMFSCVSELEYRVGRIVSDEEEQQQ